MLVRCKILWINMEGEMHFGTEEGMIKKNSRLQ